MGIALFLLYAYSLGPAVAIPYGKLFMSSAEMFALLVALYIIPLPLIFSGLDVLDYESRYKHGLARRLASLSEKELRVAVQKADSWLQPFEKRIGHAGYYVALVLVAFATGFLWAAAVAYVFRINRRPAYAAIALGTVLGLLFWFGVVEIGLVIPAPVFLAIVAVPTIVSLIGGKLHEHRTVDIVSKLREVKAALGRTALKSS